MEKHRELLTNLDIAKALVRRGLVGLREGYKLPKTKGFCPDKTVRMTNADVAEEAIKRGLFIISDV